MLLRCLIIRSAAYYDIRSISNCYKALEIYTGYFDSLDIMILFSYPSSVIITRDTLAKSNDSILYDSQVLTVYKLYTCILSF